MTRNQDNEQCSVLRAETANMVVRHQPQSDTAPSNTVIRNPAPDAAPAAAPSSSIAYGTFRISR
jgi:hypothetical protein